MHKLPNQTSVVRFRFAAILLVAKWLLFSSTLIILGYSVLTDARELAYLAMGLFAVAMTVWFTHSVISQRTKCPLCLAPSFSHQLHAKSKRATHFLGSYPLLVALSVVFRGSFRCPYCGEPTALKARQRGQSLDKCRF